MFDNLIGNEKVKQDLNQVLQRGNISHSYLLIGTKGIGKSLFAKEFAKGIMCLDDTRKPCLHCKSCLEFTNHNHPDFYYIGIGEENSIKIDVIREMQKKVQELPIVSKRKVYIIDDFECMTKEAQNCLLKTIEEPPEFVTVILITSNESKILNTIKSRCIKIYFNNIQEEQLKNYLLENYSIQDISTNMLRAYNGSIGKAILMQEKQKDYATLEKVFSNIEKYNVITAMRELEILYKDKENISNMLDYINVVLLEKAKEEAKYVQYINAVEQAKKNIVLNCNYDMTIDSLLFSIW